VSSRLRNPPRRSAVIIALALGAPAIVLAAASDPTELEEVVVTAPFGPAIARDRVPARVQTAGTEQIAALQPLDLTELLNRGFGSVTINHAQNNPLQPDVNFRGQTASPLLGIAQGLAVYANGVRMNETFGDTVNWDLLPVSAVDSVQLLAGTNPVFGLNALGGALSLQLKNGFNFDGASLDASGGSFGRRTAIAQAGDNNGRWGYYGNFDYFAEDGWRDFSASDAVRGYGAIGYRNGEARLDLALSHADSELRGNGSSPAELLAIDRRQVFTHPDITRNRLTQVVAEGAMAAGDNLHLSGNTFYRELRTRTFNGDGTIFSACGFGANDYLVEDDFTDVDGDGACSSSIDGNISLVRDPAGNPIDSAADGEARNAINNIGRRSQRSHGASAQLTNELALGDSRRNNLTLGLAWLHGRSGFDSVMEIAQLTDDRATTRTGILADEYRTAVDSTVRTWSLYAIDTLDVTRRLSLVFGWRYDNSRIALADRSGQSPELDGRHRYARLNPSAGLIWRGAAAQVYGSISQASRTPTAVELACADENAPCSLPNAFLADPPLKEVVAHSAEMGVRGRLAGGIAWELGAYVTRHRDDILFQTTGGAQANVGYFANASDTLRRGVELSLEQQLGPVHWQLSYSRIDATFRDPFVVSSPNHPQSIDGRLLVPSGARIPGIARHQANLGLDLHAAPRWRLGADLNFRSGVYLRGDEINSLGLTHAYTVVNLRTEFQYSANLRVFARVENLLDSRYENFGLLGDPTEIFPDFENPRFYGAGPPRGAWLGVRLLL
jgi:iron complex outermembrane recepter protein